MIKLIYGSEEFLNKLHISNIVKKNNLKKENIFYFSVKELSLFEIIDKTKNDNLFNEKQLFIIKDIDQIFNKKNNDEVLLYLKKHLFFNKDNIIIITSDKNELKDQFDIITSLRQHKNVIWNKKISQSETKVLIKKALKNRNINIYQDNLLEEILLKTDGKLRDIISEINKLELIKDKIKEKNIDNFIFESVTTNVFNLTNSIIEQNNKKILSEYQKITKKGINPLSILSLLSLNFGIIYSISLASRHNISTRELIVKLKKPPFVIHRYKKIASYFKFEKISKIIDKLADLEFGFKSGELQDFNLIELFLISLI